MPTAVTHSDCCALAGVKRNDQSHGGFRAEDITVEEQIDRLGFGRFQMIVLVAFFALKVSDGMELATGNFIWRGIGETPTNLFVQVQAQQMPSGHARLLVMSCTCIVPLFRQNIKLTS